MRYFRSLPGVYAGVCAALDAAYGYPDQDTKTQRSLPLAVELPSDAEGRVYLAIEQAYCDYVLPSQLLPELIGDGAVEEITADQYAAVLPSPF
jgi:hypothetical protein